MRARIAVVDANAFWTERLFAACGAHADVLLIKPRELRAHRARHGRWRSDAGYRPVADGVWEQRLAMPPRWMFELWPWARRRIARTASRFLGTGGGSLVLTYPQYLAVADALPRARLVYYNMDDYRDNWPPLARLMDAMEEAMVGRADLTVCIAGARQRALRERVPDAEARICHLPIGCTPEFMVRDVPSTPLALPDDIRDLPRPVVGHLGALDRRFDHALMLAVARALPQVTFALAGTVPDATQGDAAWWANARACLAQPNVRFVGRVPHERVGRWLQSCDVLLMCYADNRFNRNACPAKLWDYLGTSLPIVANDVVPELLEWRDHLYLGADAGAMAAAVREALCEDRETRGAARLAIARAHTWDRLAARLGVRLAALHERAA